MIIQKSPLSAQLLTRCPHTSTCWATSLLSPLSPPGTARLLTYKRVRPGSCLPWQSIRGALGGGKKWRGGLWEDLEREINNKLRDDSSCILPLWAEGPFHRTDLRGTRSAGVLPCSTMPAVVPATALTEAGAVVWRPTAGFREEARDGEEEEVGGGRQRPKVNTMCSAICLVSLVFWHSTAKPIDFVWREQLFRDSTVSVTCLGAEKKHDVHISVGFHTKWQKITLVHL